MRIEQRLTQAYVHAERSRRLVSLRRRPSRAALWLLPAVIAGALVVGLSLSQARTLIFESAASPTAAPPQGASAASPSRAPQPIRLGLAGDICAAAVTKDGIYAGSRRTPADTRCELHRSTDRGTSWARVDFEESVSALAETPAGDALLVGTDQGAIWRIAGRDARLVHPAATFKAPLTRFLVTEGGIFAARHGVLRSMDGSAWEDLGLTEASPDLRLRFFVTGMAYAQGSVLVATSGGVAGGLWVHDQSSGIWRRIEAPALYSLAGDGSELIVGAQRQDPTRPFAYLSVDGGKEWRALQGPAGASVAAGATAATPLGIVVGTNSAGVLRWDGSDWRQLGDRPTPYVRTLAWDDQHLYIGTVDGLWVYSMSDRQ